MSKRLDVLEAVKAMIQSALPDINVVGLDGEDAAPADIPAVGGIVVRSGDPGDPEVDLSPLTYNYDHRIPVEVVAAQTDEATTEQSLDAMLGAIGAVIAADRTLGGLCTWLEARAPVTEDIYAEGGLPPRGADLIIVAQYATADPLN